jgi:DNA-binding LytR/AlgR family response regulator
MEPVKVLIIEDEMIIAADISSVLTDAGHTVIGIGTDVREVLALVKSNPPEVAIVDITLGNVEDGGIRIMNEVLRVHWMPIIYLTARSDQMMIQKAALTGPSAYLFKPFRPGELLVQVQLAYENFGKLNHATAQSDTFYFPSNTGHNRVKGSEILFLKAQGHCTNIYLTGVKSPQMIGTNLGTLVKYFKSSNFLRLSKSLFINLDHLRQIERTHIYLGDEKLPVQISEANRKELVKKLQIIRTK